MKLHISRTAAILSLLAITNLPNQCNASAKTTKLSSKSAKATYPSAERAITMWWVLFNKPSECTSNPTEAMKCGVPDIMMNVQGGTNTPEIAIISASGGISDKDGFLRLSAALYKTYSCELDLDDRSGTGHYLFGGPAALYGLTESSPGYCPAENEDTEVHIVLRDHGPVTSDKIWQMTRFTDPSCSQNGGPNLCSDIGAVGFPPMAGNGMMSKDVGHFPVFYPGCSAADECDEAVEMIQLSAGMGNEVTFIKSGDAIQVVAEFTAPMV